MTAKSDPIRQELLRRGFKIGKIETPAEAAPEPEPPAPPEPVKPPHAALAAASGYEPRIKGTDSHDVIIEAGGRVVYIPRDPQPAQQCSQEVCENAGASDPRRFRR